MPVLGRALLAASSILIFFLCIGSWCRTEGTGLGVVQASEAGTAPNVAVVGIDKLSDGFQAPQVVPLPIGEIDSPCTLIDQRVRRSLSSQRRGYSSPQISAKQCDIANGSAKPIGRSPENDGRYWFNPRLAFPYICNNAGNGNWLALDQSWPNVTDAEARAMCRAEILSGQSDLLANLSQLSAAYVPESVRVDGNNHRRQSRDGSRIPVCINPHAPCVPTEKQQDEGQTFVIGLIGLIVWYCVEAVFKRRRKPKKESRYSDRYSNPKRPPPERSRSGRPPV